MYTRSVISFSELFKTKRTINLLPKSGEDSVVGQILNWSLNIGKWIVVVTQFIVVIVFLMRFSLDRKLTNLHKDIKSELARIKSYESIEGEFRKTQSMLKFVKPIIVQQKTKVAIIDYLLKVMPYDMWVSSISIGNNSVNITISTGSINSLGKFIKTLEHDEVLKNISIQNIESVKDDVARFQFKLSAQVEDIKE